jgi:hypothetical protein
MLRTELGRRRSLGFLLAVAIVLLIVSGAARAQDLSPQVRIDSRWQPWLGCWTLNDIVTAIVHPGQQVCVVPASGTSAVDVVSLDGPRILSRERIAATGERHTVEAGGCTGWQRAEWSPDGHRVYLTSEATCQDGITRRSAGLFAISSSGDWLHVGSMTVGDHSSVGVIVQSPSIFVPSVPDVASALQPIDRASVMGARAGASRPIAVADITEVTHHVSAAVVEAWLAASGQVFTVDARQLVALADAGVPDRVIDMVVALANPQAFAIVPSGTAPGELAVVSADRTDLDPLFLDEWGPWPYGVFSVEAFAPGLPPYAGTPGRGWYAGRPPLVIVPTPNGRGGDASHGQVVSGRGYVAGSGATSGTATGTTATAPPATGSSTPASGESGATPSGTPSGGTAGSGGERIAKPR